MVFEVIRRYGTVTWEHVAENCMGNSDISEIDINLVNTRQFYHTCG